MHLLKITPKDDSSLDIDLQENLNEDFEYVILSHRWGSIEDEVSYYDFTKQNDIAQKKKGYQKIEACCRQAVKDKIYYAWIDTCCIDKSSSAELSEAMNSMYRWYERSTICYAYLEDVAFEDYVKSNSTFRCSKWFTRGWTLQELIAPTEVRFYKADWAEIGSKSKMADTLSEITNIPKDVLLNKEPIEDICVSQKMFWASSRQTSRVEDRAYSLLGLFNLSLPIIYGEGERSFRRLQEEIVRSSFDHTIFAWEMTTSSSGLLARSPNAFAQAAKIQKMPLGVYGDLLGLGARDLVNEDITYNSTNLGLRIGLLYDGTLSSDDIYPVFLACYAQDKSEAIVIYLRSNPWRPEKQFFRTRTMKCSLKFSRFCHDYLEKHIFWVMEPEKAYIKALRDVIPPERKMGDTKYGHLTKYHLLRFSGLFGRIAAAFPAPNVCKQQSLSIETEAEFLWIISIELNDKMQGVIFLTVLDDELIGHIDVDDGRNNVQCSTSNALESCEMHYERCKSSCDTPCTGRIVKASHMTNGLATSSTADDDDDDMVITLYENSELGRHEQHLRITCYVKLIAETRLQAKQNAAARKNKLVKLRESTLSLEEIVARCKPL